MKITGLLLFFVASFVLSQSHSVRFYDVDAKKLSICNLSVQVGDTVIFKGFFNSYHLKSVIIPEEADEINVNSGFIYRYIVKHPGKYSFTCNYMNNYTLTGVFNANGNLSNNNDALINN